MWIYNLSIILLEEYIVNSDVLDMLKKVILYNTVLGLVCAFITYFVFEQAVLTLLAGVFIGVVNFMLNSILTEIILRNFKNGYAPIYIFSFLIRISLVALIGFVIFAHNKYNVLFFMSGYIINLMSIYLYSLKVKNA
jgi:ATP synthase protein I